MLLGVKSSGVTLLHIGSLHRYKWVTYQGALFAPVDMLVGISINLTIAAVVTVTASYSDAFNLLDVVNC